MSSLPAAPLELIVLSKATFATYELPAHGVVVLGRSERSDLRIDDPSVTRRHARLHLGARLELEDLGSANGTRVRQQRLEVGRRTEVFPGEAFHVGTVLLMVQRREPAAGVAPRADETETRREERDGLLGAARSSVGAGPVVEASLAAGASSRRVARVVRDPAMLALEALIERVAPGTISVLVLGETGVGKELVAERLHACSPRRDRPLVRLNCAALPESVLEAEWFGYERGAFTGATQAKPGLLESAEGGTVFLDEIGEMPLAVQAKILRVVEAQETLRLGALRPRPLDVRFVSATHRTLEGEVARGRFRQDLLYRLNGVSLHVPPLRERTSEIELLAEAFIASVSRALGRSAPPRLGPDALQLLQRYAWPGNVRELRNFVERAVLLSSGPELGPEHFPLAAMASTLPLQRIGDATAPVALEARALTESPASSAGAPAEREQERERILQVLAECGGNQSRAAKVLGIARSTLVLRLDAYGTTRPRKR